MSIITTNCLVCDGTVVLKEGTEVSEIISCPECSTKLVVESVGDGNVVLSQAPEVEEDWGE